MLFPFANHNQTYCLSLKKACRLDRRRLIRLMPGFMTAYWSGAPRSSLQGKIFGKKIQRLPEQRQRGLYPKSKREIHGYGQTSHHCRESVRERRKYPLWTMKTEPQTPHRQPRRRRLRGFEIFIWQLHIVSDNDFTKSVERVLDMLLVFFCTGHRNSLFP